MEPPVQPLPRLYDEFADWFHLLTPPSEYGEEAAYYTALIREDAEIEVREVLELGSGGGNIASYMKHNFRMTLTDVSPRMLEISRRINPELPHIEGDMRTVDLGREFDAVFVHDAVMYMLSAPDLEKAIDTAYRHCRPGGVVIFAPDCVKESWQPPSTESGGHDAPDGRGLRYLEWSYDPDPEDNTFICEMVYLLRDADGVVSAEYDRHTMGIFSRQMWLNLLIGAGFETRIVPLIDSEVAPGEVEIFVATKPLR